MRRRTPKHSSTVSRRGKASVESVTCFTNRSLRARGWRNVRTLNRCDGAEHARYRKLVERVFTPKIVRVSCDAPALMP